MDFDTPSQKIKIGAVAGVLGLHALAAFGLATADLPKPQEKTPKTPPIEIQMITLPPPTEVEKKPLPKPKPKPPEPEKMPPKTEPLENKLAENKPPNKSQEAIKADSEPKAAPEPKFEKMVEEEVLLESMAKPQPTTSKEDPISPKPKPEPKLIEEPIIKPKPEPEPIKEAAAVKEQVYAVDNFTQQHDWLVEQQKIEADQRKRAQDAAKQAAIEAEAAAKRQTELDAAKRQEDLQKETRRQQDLAQQELAKEAQRKQQEAARQAEAQAAAAKAKADAEAKARADAEAAAKKAAEAASDTPVKFSASNADWLTMPRFEVPSQVEQRAKSGDTFEVVLLLRVNKQGKIERVRLVKSSGNATLDREAQRQVKSGRFRPFQKDNVTVVGDVNFTVGYEIL